MIRRYSVKKINNIFSDQQKYNHWIKIEIILLRYLSSKGFIDSDEVDKIESQMVALPDQIRREEKKINHDVAAFVNCVARTVDSVEKKWIHYGLTSSDLVDTGNSMMLREANHLVLDHLYRLLRRLKKLSYKHKKTYYLNRKGGKIKGVSSFGHTLSTYYSLIKECIEQFDALRPHVECVSLSGSVGTCSYFGTDLQDYAASELGLFSVPISTQVVSRDRYFSYFSCLAQIGQIINRLSVELRLLTKTEIQEVAESFEKHQIGSSSMPHKKNPITLENICGLYRLLEGYMVASSKNSLIWFERDISHSSADRVLFVDALSIVVQMMRRMSGVLDGLFIDKERMEENLKNNLFVVLQPNLKKFLLNKKLAYSDKEADFYLNQINNYATDSGIGLKKAFTEWDGAKKALDYEIERIFDLDWCFGYLDSLYRRIFGDSHKKCELDDLQYESSEIEYAINILAEKLNYEYRNVVGSVQILSFRDGCNPFLSKLTIKLKFSWEIHTVNSSLIKYWRQKGYKGKNEEAEIKLDPVLFKNKHVLVVDELLDTGTTLEAFLSHIKSFKPKSLKSCVMFYVYGKEDMVEFKGLPLSSANRVVGFGMDIDEKYRNSKFVGRLRFIS